MLLSSWKRSISVGEFFHASWRCNMARLVLLISRQLDSLAHSLISCSRFVSCAPPAMFSCSQGCTNLLNICRSSAGEKFNGSIGLRLHGDCKCRRRVPGEFARWWRTYLGPCSPAFWRWRIWYLVSRRVWWVNAVSCGWCPMLTARCAVGCLCCVS